MIMRSSRTLTACVIIALMNLLISKPSQGLPTPPPMNRTADALVPCEACLPISTRNTYTENGMSWTYISSTTYIPFIRKFTVTNGIEELYDDPAYRNSPPREAEAISNKVNKQGFSMPDEQDALPEILEEDSSTQSSYIYVTREDSLKPEDFDESD